MPRSAHRSNDAETVLDSGPVNSRSRSRRNPTVLNGTRETPQTALDQQTCRSEGWPVIFDAEEVRVCLRRFGAPGASRPSGVSSLARRGSRSTCSIGERSAGRPRLFRQGATGSTRAVGLDGVQLHDISHGFASLLVAAGTNVRVAADLLGHSTISFTLQTYVHTDEDAAAVAIDEAERLLGGGASF